MTQGACEVRGARVGIPCTHKVLGNLLVDGGELLAVAACRRVELDEHVLGLIKRGRIKRRADQFDERPTLAGGWRLRAHVLVLLACGHGLGKGDDGVAVARERAGGRVRKLGAIRQREGDERWPLQLAGWGDVKEGRNLLPLSRADRRHHSLAAERCAGGTQRAHRVGGEGAVVKVQQVQRHVRVEELLLHLARRVRGDRRQAVRASKGQHGGVGERRVRRGAQGGGRAVVRRKRDQHRLCERAERRELRHRRRVDC